MPDDTLGVERAARKRRIVASAVASACNVGVFILYQLVSLPIFLASYGDRRYSDWLVLYSLPALLSVSDLGIPAVVGSQMTMLRAAGELRQARNLYMRMRELGRRWLLVLLGILLAITWVANPVTLLHLRTLDILSARVTLTELAVWLIMNLYWGVYSAGYQATMQFHRNLRLLAATRTTEFAAIIALVACGESLPVLAGGIVMIRLIASLWVAVDFRKRTPWGARPREKPIHGDFAIRSLVSPALASMAFPAGSTIQNQGLLLVVSWRAGAAAVVIVNSIRTITNASYQLNTFLKAGITPELSDRFGVGDVAGARDIAEKVTAVVVVANVILAIGIAGFGAPFLHLWSGGRLTAAWYAVALFGLSSTTDCLWHSMSNVAQAKNVHQRIALVYLLACVAVLPLCYWLAPSNGLIGIGLSLFTTSVAVNLVTLPTVCALLQTTVREYTLQSFRYTSRLLHNRPLTSLRGLTG